MSNSGTKSTKNAFEKHLSEIIQRELIDLYGGSEYKSIMQTMIKISGRKEEKIITNYELFAELSEGVFGRLAESKNLGFVRLEMDKIGKSNIQQRVPSKKRSMRILIADDEPDILSLYKTFLEAKGKEIIVTTDGRKCVETYKINNNSNQLEKYFDIVLLDQKMPFMTGLQAAIESLKINSRQKIIFVSGHLEKYY